MHSRAIVTVAFSVLLATSSPADPAPGGQAVLEQNCYGCHTQASPKGGLDLRSRESILRGGGRGAAIIPGDASKSLIVQAVEGSGDLKMPPGKKLSAEAIANLRQWIDAGAPWRDAKPDDLWAFQPVRKSQAPAGVDAFISQTLHEAGLQAAPPADKATL